MIPRPYDPDYAQEFYEHGYMDRFAPPLDTPPGVATGYIRPAGWEVREYVDGRLVWYCRINKETK